MKDGRRYAGLHLLDDDVTEAEALEFSCEFVDFTEGIDDPALTEFAKEKLLGTT